MVGAKLEKYQYCMSFAPHHCYYFLKKKEIVIIFVMVPQDICVIRFSRVPQAQIVKGQVTNYGEVGYKT